MIFAIVRFEMLTVTRESGKRPESNDRFFT
jgi:hypothetical protein